MVIEFTGARSRRTGSRKEQGILVSLLEGCYHLPTSSSKIWGEWEQWYLTLFMGDWRKEVPLRLGNRRNYGKGTRNA